MEVERFVKPQVKCMEEYRDLYTTFVDQTKAFDTVSRDGLWKIMEKFGCPSTFIAIVSQYHDGMMARVLDDGEPFKAFPVTNGVKQSCVLAPTLFSILLLAMLSDAFGDCGRGVLAQIGRISHLRTQRTSSTANKMSWSSSATKDEHCLVRDCTRFCTSSNSTVSGFFVHTLSNSLRIYFFPLWKAD